ncbi:YagK/YfjJ domain-containing protein [Methylovulum psychrotolerans]|uniref:Inovirus Gp2 family protein n=1 Tax=Methylovulum psychrotolerans TaxID=1704499 RepID=A0A1Z4BVG1_9GAMM|nr:inovirus-type Gp2 protein [Methylovulum psychrotolerans]ASF45230.1 hypothetical protein CEK71_03660 [Methylovulum psychrotolerans]
MKSERFDNHLRRVTYENLCDSLFDPAKNQYPYLIPKFYASQLSILEDFVGESLENVGTPFTTYLGNNGKIAYAPSSLAQRYFVGVPSFIKIVNMLSPDYDYSERITIFIACYQAMGLHGIELGWGNINFDSTKTYPHMGGISAAEIFNALVNNIRREWKLNNIQTKVNSRKIEANRRYIDYCRYVDALFGNCARLLVLRIDLFYKKEHSQNFSAFDITEDLNHLFENKRCNSIFDFMKGYIAKLEYGVDKGMHWHVLFFFDGSKRNNSSHIHLAEEIGEYWKNTITKGYGDYWNVNKNLRQYAKLRRQGIGVINWQDIELRANLKGLVIQYLCKTDQYIKPKFGTKVRLFRRGNFPSHAVKKRGRPRHNEASYAASDQTGKNRTLSNPTP